MISTIIIDDEQDARENLQILLDTYCKGEIAVIGEADNIADGAKKIDALKPDMVLLDIAIGNTTGFDMLEKIAYKDFILIFITAHSEFAAKAFRFDALDYLLKPIDPDHLIKAVGKAKKQDPLDKFSHHFEKMMEKKSTQKITVKTKEGTTFISIEDIIRIKGEGNYSYLYLKTGENIMASKNLKSFEENLNSDFFCRTHQSYIVNFKYLKQYLTKDGTYVVTTDGNKTPVSRGYKNIVVSFIDKLLN